MAFSTAQFDANCFDVAGFDALSPTPVVQMVSVPKEMRVVETGQHVSVFAYVIDVETTPGRWFYFNPAEVPQIEVYDPFDTLHTAFTPMQTMGVGVYSYTISSGMLQWRGPYAVRIMALNGDKLSVTRKQIAFTTV